MSKLFYFFLLEITFLGQYAYGMNLKMGPYAQKDKNQVLAIVESNKDQFYFDDELNKVHFAEKFLEKIGKKPEIHPLLRWINERRGIVSYDSNDIIRGFLGYTIETRKIGPHVFNVIGFIDIVGVEKKYQENKIGLNILTKAIQELQQNKDINFVVAFSRADNFPAEKFFLKAGFKVTEKKYDKLTYELKINRKKD